MSKKSLPILGAIPMVRVSSGGSSGQVPHASFCAPDPVSRGQSEVDVTVQVSILLGLSDAKIEGGWRVEGRGLGGARLVDVHLSLNAAEEDRLAVGRPAGGWH